MDTRILTQERMEKYRRFLAGEERAPATVEKYLQDIRAFAAWTRGRPVDRELACGWKAALLARGLAPATVNAKLSALNGLLRHLGWGDCRVRLLKLQRRAFRDPGRELTREEYQRLLSAAGVGAGSGWRCCWRRCAPPASGSLSCASSRWRPPGGAGPTWRSRARCARCCCRGSCAGSC